MRKYCVELHTSIRSVGVGYPGVCCVRGEPAAGNPKRVWTLSSAAPIARKGVGHEQGEAIGCVSVIEGTPEDGTGEEQPPPPMKLPPVPKDSPLGFMLAEWKQYPGTGDKDKAKMIHYCVEVWGRKKYLEMFFGLYLGHQKIGSGRNSTYG
ncbi:hypothetical protein DUI87_02762 [Hirundo rustica rustica]|uniref:Uncharacterized protein n=1 Tax=Hirundo rustica rustica TaxID=333673 RepID=A0A3M0L9V3_HIRRU|nr:hypothetical protein DUI87_02762 [Hirundo rustica rustica]